jgi:aminobenzoyl-glutamate transport protein
MERKKNRNLSSFYGPLVVALVLAEVVLVLLSWLLSAMMTDGVRSLLSSGGIRWFFGQFTAMIATPLLVWIVLLSMALGCLWRSRLPASLSASLSSRLSYRERVALRTVAVLLLVYVGVVVALTAIPHAVLLSATGQLFPSAFSRALVPIVAFGIGMLSVVYGLMSGRFRSSGDIVDSASYGIRQAAPLFLIYVLAVLLYESLRFVFG